MGTKMFASVKLHTVSDLAAKVWSGPGTTMLPLPSHRAGSCLTAVQHRGYSNLEMLSFMR
jgi:hypothetical protein